MRLTIAICTADRPALLDDLLASLAHATTATWTRDVLVVDNGREAMTSIASHHPSLPLRVVRAPRNNIAQARNTALRLAEGELVLWLDDDQLVAPSFMHDLERAWSHRPPWSDGVRLSVTPRFEGAQVSPLARRWFEPTTTLEGQPIARRAFSTNGLVLVRERALSVRGPDDDGPFDRWFGTRGSEDTDFFLRASAAGLRFSATRLAGVIERIPETRARLAYIARAAFRVGFTDTVLSRRARFPVALAAEVMARVAVDVALAPVLVADPDGRGLLVLDACRQAGKLWALAGRDFEHYRPR